MYCPQPDHVDLRLEAGTGLVQLILNCLDNRLLGALISPSRFVFGLTTGNYCFFSLFFFSQFYSVNLSLLHTPTQEPKKRLWRISYNKGTRSIKVIILSGKYYMREGERSWAWTHLLLKKNTILFSVCKKHFISLF